ncbi:hypothetical protein C0992_013006, partial [Termitomyces sp. T32_za158]
MKDLVRKPGSRTPSPSPQITLPEPSAIDVPTLSSSQDPSRRPIISPQAPVLVTSSEGAPPKIYEGATIVSNTANQAEISESNVCMITQRTSSTEPGNILGLKAKDGFKTAWHGLKMILGQVEGLLGGTPFKMPVTAVNMLIQLGDAIGDNHESLKELMIGIQKQVEIIGEALVSNDTADTASRKMKENFVRLLVEDLFELHKLENNGLWRDILEYEQVKTEIQRILKNVDKNCENFKFQIMLRIERNTADIFESLVQNQFRDWPHSQKALYNADLEDETKFPRGPCTPDTRVSILEKIYQWAQDATPELPHVFWLTGQAGSGKSTIAYTVAQHFDQEVNVNNPSCSLQATFFCSRQFNETKLQRFIIPTIVYQLAHNSVSFAHSLRKRNEFDSVDISSKQMKDLLAIPWQKSVAKHATNLPPYLIVIDALDEIEGGKGSAFLKELLTTINDHCLSGLKFLVTSRPDPEIVHLCKQFTSNAVCHLHDIPQENVQEDIYKYLNASLSKLQNDSELVNLAKKADGLFIYASTAVKYISHPKGSSLMEQQKKLKKLLESSFTMKKQFSHIDEIYCQILYEAFIDFDNDDLNARLRILHTFLCAEERISSTLAAALVNSKDIDQANNVVEKLYAVLFVKNHLAKIIKSSKYKSKALNIIKDLQDAVNFTEYFSAGKATLSTPHLYISALATWAGNELLTKWKSQFRFLPLIEGYKTSWPILNTYSMVTSVAFSLDGMQIVSGSFDNSVQVWNALTGEQVQKLQGHNHLVTSVAFSPDGTQIVSGSYDNSVRVWNALTGKQVQKLENHNHWVTSVAFSPDGTQIVSGSYDKSVQVWNVLNGQQVQEFQGHTDSVTSVAFSPDGSAIISGSYDNSVRVWNVLTDKQVQELQGHTAQVESVAFSLDGTQIVSGSYDKSVRVWDALTGQQIQELQGHTDPVTSVAFSPNGTQIVSGSFDNFVRVWDTLTSKQVQELQGHTDSVTSVAFSSDGTQIVSGSSDNSIRVWDALTGKQVQKLQYYPNLVFSINMFQIESESDDDSVQMWDALTGKQVHRSQGHTFPVTSVAFSPNRTQIVSASNDNSVRVWDALTGKQVQKLQGHNHWVSSVVFSPDGTQIVSGSSDNSIRVWDALTGKQVQKLQGHIFQVASIAFSPDGTQIVSGSYDDSVQVWDVLTGKQVQDLQGHTYPVASVAFSLDGTQIVSGSYDKSVRVWNTLTGKQVQELQGHTGPVTSVAFSPDGTQIVSGSYDKSVRVWDALTGKQVENLQGHNHWVSSVVFSPDGTQIVSGSSDHSVRVWDALTITQVQELQGHTDPVTSVAFSSDGTQIVSGSYDNSVRVWDALIGKQVQKLQVDTFQ